MDTEKKVIDMTNSEIIETYEKFGVKPLIDNGTVSLGNDCPPVAYKKCSILEDYGIRYSYYSNVS